MEGPSTSSLHIFLILFIFVLQFTTSSIAKTLHNVPYHRKRNIQIQYIKSSCNTTTYPILCYRTLSIYATKINTSPRLITLTALIVTLKASKSTSRLMRRISRIHDLKPRVASALTDCIEVIDDSVDELRKSIDELVSIKRSNFTITVSDIQTWVSAALTDEDTCMDGFEGEAMDGNVKKMVRKLIVEISHLCSNALALVNNFCLP